MPDDEHLAVLRRGAAAWIAWRAKHDEAPDLSRAGLRGLDLSGFDLSRADLWGTNCSGATLAGAHLEGANSFKALLDGADLAGDFHYDARFLNCASWSPSGTGAAEIAQLHSEGMPDPDPEF